MSTEAKDKSATTQVQPNSPAGKAAQSPAAAQSDDAAAPAIASEVKSEVTADGMRIESNWTQVVSSFDDMALKDNLLRGIYAYGFEKPSAIQQRGIMPILSTHDTIAQAQSGTGKVSDASHQPHQF